MTALESLDALAARIAAGSGPDRQIEAEFARVVLGYSEVFVLPLSGWSGVPPGASEYVLNVAFTDDLAGPGELFAAARALWPDAETTVTSASDIAVVKIESNSGDVIGSEFHPDLCRALMLAMVAAKRAEVSNA